MRDGSRYRGEFRNGEIVGQGERIYEDGTTYVGDFHLGEKNGYGEITYGENNRREDWYKGNWCLNVRQGFGQLMMRTGKLYRGDFVNNQPNG